MTATAARTIAGTAVAIGGRGILLTGVAGAGKSELALALIDRGALLVADDLVLATARDSLIQIDAPVVGRGRIALRDIGIVSVNHAGGPVPLALVVLLDTKTPPVAGAARLDAITPISGTQLAIPRLTINPATPAAAVKLALALDLWGL